MQRYLRTELYCNNQNQNSLLVVCQIDNFSPGAVTGGGGDLPIAFTRDANFDTQRASCGSTVYTGMFQK